MRRSPAIELVNFREIETINLCDQTYLTRVEMGDLYVRTTEGNDILQFSLTVVPNLLRVRINTIFRNLLATRKTVAYGRGGIDNIKQTNVPLACEFYGQDGDDYLAGYTGNDLLVGGYGKDRLLAYEGTQRAVGRRLSDAGFSVREADARVSRRSADR